MKRPVEDKMVRPSENKGVPMCPECPWEWWDGVHCAECPDNPADPPSDEVVAEDLATEEPAVEPIEP